MGSESKDRRMADDNISVKITADASGVALGV
jgi:hypothetical protein